MAASQSKNKVLVVVSIIMLAAAAFLVYRTLTSGGSTPTASEQSANDELARKLEEANKSKAPEVPAVPGGARAVPTK